MYEIKPPLPCEWKYLFPFGCKLFNVQVATKDEIKGNSFRKKEIHSMRTEINLKSKVRLNTGGCQFYKGIKDQFYPSE